MRKHVTLLVGLPGSGKSTFAAELMAVDSDAVLISSDARIEARARRENLTYQEAYVKHAAAVLEEIFDEARLALAIGRSVIWDQTNLTPAARAERLALVPDNYARRAIAFELAELELKARLARRAAATGKIIPDAVLAKQMAAYVRPSRAEGFDSVVIIDGNDILAA